MTACDERIVKLEKEIDPWVIFDPETEKLSLRDDAPADIVEKDKLCQKLYEALVTGFPEGCR